MPVPRNIDIEHCSHLLSYLFVYVFFFFPFSYFCNSVWPLYWLYISETRQCLVSRSGADPGFFLGGGALVFCSTSTPINHIVFFSSQNTSCIRKLQVISGGGVHTPCTLPLDPPLSFHFTFRRGGGDVTLLLRYSLCIFVMYSKVPG